MNQIREIPPQEAFALIQQGWKLVDVRTPAEFSQQHAQGAINIVLNQCTAEALKNLGGTKFAIICQAGGRSLRACQNVSSDNSIETVNVLGGTTLWASSGLPLG